jgi:hypothetical protein
VPPVLGVLSTRALTVADSISAVPAAGGPRGADYSGTPQARKLGLKPGCRVALDDPPPAWHLSDPPVDIEYVGPTGAADVVVGFFGSRAELASRLPNLVQRIHPDGSLWIAWPRRAGGHDSDITDNVVRDCALPLGVVDVKIAAIDDDWSGLKFRWRRENRAVRS